MGDALFTLVREDTLDTTESLNYNAYSATNSQRDEIQLVDDLGNPCAVPVGQPIKDLDVRHDYSDGSEGNTPILLGHQIALSVEWIDDATRRRLDAWRYDRARVLFTPGFGRHTELAWRPLASSGTTISDLTGKHTFDITGDATRNLVWDDISGMDVMRGPETFTDKQRIIATPGGAGQVFERGHTNLASPDAPEPSGSSGWTAAGTGSGTLTITASGVPAAYNPHIFGPAQCYASAHVVGTATTDARMISRNFPLSGDGGPTGEGTVNNAVWLKGRLPTDAYLAVWNVMGYIGTVDLDGDYSDWTRVDLQADATNFGSGEVSLMVVMPGTADSQTCDFWVGPTVMTWEASASRFSQPYPQWQTEGAARTTDVLTTDANCQIPATGTIATSFYMPDWYEPLDSMCMGLVGTKDSTPGRLYCVAYDNYTTLRAVYYFTDTTTVEGDVSLVAGALNTITVTWDQDSSQIYHNATIIGSRSTAAYYEKAYEADEFRIGYNNLQRGAWPCIMNTVRIENEVWSATRVANEHETLTNDVAIDTIVAARGRTYAIRSIPDQPVVVGGATYWRGMLVIEQVDYTSTLADLTSAE